jgi:hypothetical protein
LIYIFTEGVVSLFWGHKTCPGTVHGPVRFAPVRGGFFLRFPRFFAADRSFWHCFLQASLRLSALGSLIAPTQKENTAAVHTGPSAFVTKGATVCQLDVPLPSSGPLPVEPGRCVVVVPITYGCSGFFLSKTDLLLPVPVCKCQPLFWGRGTFGGTPTTAFFGRAKGRFYTAPCAGKVLPGLALLHRKA